MNMNVVWERIRKSVVVAAVALGASTPAFAQDHAHGAASPSRPLTAEQQRRVNKLVAEVRDATERFKDLHVAESEGYALGFSFHAHTCSV